MKGQGIGCLTLFGIIFVVLKLCDVIAWSWWLVLVPFLIEFAIGVVLIIGLILITLIGVVSEMT